MVSLEQDNSIFILYIPVTFTPDTVSEINAKLDIVEKSVGPGSLIITSKSPKIFSAGMNLKFVANEGRAATEALFSSLTRLYGRFLNFSVPTICAFNGHVVAGGLMLGLSTDYRIMRNDQGTLKMTEIALGMNLPRGANNLFKLKVAPEVHRDLLLRGKIYSPQEALDAGIVDQLVEPTQLLATAKKMAEELSSLGEKKDVYRMLKYSSYLDEIETARKAEMTDEEREYGIKRAPKL